MKSVVVAMKGKKSYEYDAELKEYRKAEKNKRLSRRVQRDSKRIGEGEIDE